MLPIPKLSRSLPWAGLILILVGPSVPGQHRADRAEPIELALADEGGLAVTAAWDDFKSSVYKAFKRHASVRDFKPAVVRRVQPMRAFRPFLPPKPVAVGETWRLKTRRLLPILEQFHPGVTEHMHHGQSVRGSWAVLRAASATHAEIVFRIHADIMLVEGPTSFTSEWFTPGQFTGHVVIDRVKRRVAAFHLFLPPRDTNVDVNVVRRDRDGNPAGFIADIGFIPRMELVGEGQKPADASYAKSIDLPTARHLLARCFYPCEDIEWMALPAALAEAQKTKKPIHVVILFGSLDDESC